MANRTTVERTRVRRECRPVAPRVEARASSPSDSCHRQYSYNCTKFADAPSARACRRSRLTLPDRPQGKRPAPRRWSTLLHFPGVRRRSTAGPSSPRTIGPRAVVDLWQASGLRGLKLVGAGLGLSELGVITCFHTDSDRLGERPPSGCDARSLRSVRKSAGDRRQA